MIHAEALEVRYGSRQALKGISLQLTPGVVGLLGPNGAGKSTLVKTLLGLVPIAGGRAEVLGIDPQKNPRRIRQQIGYMPEDDCFFPALSGVRSIAYLGELSGLPCRAALGRAHELADFVGLAEERYRPVQTYSTGMRQKVKLAQALVHDPRLIFLDEPTNGLDPASRRRMLSLIQFVARVRGASVILSTHLLPDVEALCDSAVILEQGKILLAGPLAELQKPARLHYQVTLDGDAGRFAASLADHGMTGEWIDEISLRVTGSDLENLPARLFLAARAAGAVLRRIEPARTSLEEVFLEATTGRNHADR